MANEFPAGKVVWVRARRPKTEIFWPAKVVEPIINTGRLKKKVIALVHFLGEDTLDDVRDAKDIKAWDCPKQASLISKGATLRRPEKKICFSNGVAEAKRIMARQTLTVSPRRSPRSVTTTRSVHSKDKTEKVLGWVSVDICKNTKGQKMEGKKGIQEPSSMCKDAEHMVKRVIFPDEIKTGTECNRTDNHKRIRKSPRKCESTNVQKNKVPRNIKTMATESSQETSIMGSGLMQECKNTVMQKAATDNELKYDNDSDNANKKLADENAKRIVFCDETKCEIKLGKAYMSRSKHKGITGKSLQKCKNVPRNKLPKPVKIETEASHTESMGEGNTSSLMEREKQGSCVVKSTCTLKRKNELYEPDNDKLEESVAEDKTLKRQCTRKGTERKQSTEESRSSCSETCNTTTHDPSRAPKCRRDLSHAAHPKGEKTKNKKASGKTNSTDRHGKPKIGKVNEGSWSSGKGSMKESKKLANVKNNDNMLGGWESDDSSDKDLMEMALHVSPSKDRVTFALNDVVWAKIGREPYWPAQIKRIQGKKTNLRKFYVKFLGYSTKKYLSCRVVVPFACDVDKRDRLMGVAKRFNQELFEEAFTMAEDLVRRKALGISMSEDEEEEYVLIDSQENEEMEDTPTQAESFQEEKVVRKSSRQKRQVLQYGRDVLPFIRQARPFLKQIFEEKRHSERHEIFRRGNLKDKDSLKRRSGFGPVADQEVSNDVMELLRSFYRELVDTDEDFAETAYLYDVWLPEAMIFAIQKRDHVERQRAENMYQKGTSLTASKDDLEATLRQFKERSMSEVERSRRIEHAKYSLSKSLPLGI